VKNTWDPLFLLLVGWSQASWKPFWNWLGIHSFSRVQVGFCDWKMFRLFEKPCWRPSQIPDLKGKSNCWWRIITPVYSHLLPWMLVFVVGRVAIVTREQSFWCSMTSNGFGRMAIINLMSMTLAIDYRF
jgi:hypothetical protein